MMGEAKKRRLDTEGLWSYALRLLGGRAHSTGEMREKLRRRAARLGDVADVLVRLKDHGYLRERRVAPALAERSVREVYQDVNEEALIEEWIRRKYRSAPRESLFQQDKDLAAAYRRLLRAGFRSGEIVRVLKRFAKNPDLLDSLEPPDEMPRE